MSAIARVAFVAAMLATLAFEEPARAAFPGTNGKIAFASPGGVEAIQPDGTGRALLVAGADQPAWSPDGSRILLVTSTGDLAIVNADGTGLTPLGLTAADPGAPAWSPDGKKIIYESGNDIWTANADGSAATNITGTPSIGERLPAWSPALDKVAFATDTGIAVSHADGSGRTVVTTGVSPSWSPDGHRLVFADSVGGQPAEIFTASETGANRTQITSNTVTDNAPSWSPDEQKITFYRNAPDSFRPGADIWTMNADGTGALKLTTDGNQQDVTNFFPDWQPIPYTGYPRPKGATPIRMTLVPAFAACTSANTTHGAPLAFGSCSPPSQASPNLTVGTPDANGAAANSTGFVRFRAFAGVPGPPDESNIAINFSLTDVRCGAAVATCGAANASGGADYTGELRVEFDARLTDKDNSPLVAATANDFGLAFSVSCSGTADTATGSTCAVNTSTAVFLGVCFRDAKRSVWELRDVRVMDGGPDGDGDTAADNSLFERPGLFVP